MNMRDNETLAPLHFTSQHGHLDMTRLLLDHGVDPNIKRKDLWSPLHLASANGHLKIAELLIQRGASLEVFDDEKKTPLYQAVMNERQSCDRLSPNRSRSESKKLLTAMARRCFTQRRNVGTSKS